MADQDPAIEQAKALLQVGATKLAFNTLAKRINVLNAEVKMLQTIVDGVERAQQREASAKAELALGAARKRKQPIIANDARSWILALIVVLLPFFLCIILLIIDSMIK